MPRKRKSDLEQFQLWLEQSKFLESSSASVYASHVRAVLGWLEECDIQNIDEVSEGFRRMSSATERKAMSGRKTAWSHFVDYAYQEKKIVLAKPKSDAYRTGPRELPHSVRAALMWLVSGKRFQHSQIAALRWSMFATALPSVDEVTLHNPFNPSEQISVPKGHYEAMRLYAATPAGIDGALIPVYSGSPVPYPWRTFRRELRAYKDAVSVGEIVDNWEVFADPRSAIAVDVAAKAEMEQVLAQRAGIRTELEDFEPGHSTADLMNLLERGVPLPVDSEQVNSKQPGPEQLAPKQPALPREELADAVGLNAGSLRVGESSRHTRHTGHIRHPKEAPSCAVCEYPREVHAIAFGLTDGTISNCAVENGYPEDACQMCDNGCYGRHSFQAKS
jgi:hypothetical protein